MDWATIWSNNITSKILEYRKNHSVSERVVPSFYMSAYIMDTICFSFDFPSMGWKWTIEDPTPIYLYHDILWESKYCLIFIEFSIKLCFLCTKEFLIEMPPGYPKNT